MLKSVLLIKIIFSSKSAHMSHAEKGAFALRARILDPQKRNSDRPFSLDLNPLNYLI
jgi:hypothetical protein